MPLTTNFGAVAEIYDQARPQYAQQLMDYVASFCQGRILDVGCGTGIVTRQLAERSVDVVGCDGDERMIAVASSHKQPSIDYFVGSADTLPFQENEFDAVTAFTAFHFFYDDTSIAGIQKVLKKNGLFIVAEGVKDHNEPDYFRACVEEVIPAKLRRNQSIDVEEIFRAKGLEKIAGHEFRYELQYSVDKYLLYMQSRSYWNDVPEEQKSRVLEYAREHFTERYPDNKVPVPRHYALVVGKLV